MTTKRDIFIITSVISPTHKKLSYSDTRSVYTENERVDQTIESIASIKRHCPEAKIFLIEAGQKNFDAKFQGLVNEYIYLGNKRLVRSCTDSSFKGLGEIVSLIYALGIIKNEEAVLVFKLSGRYSLNENFNRQGFSEDSLNFKSQGKSLSTRLYSFPKKKLPFFIATNILIAPFLLSGISIERIYYLVFKLFCFKIKNIVKLGVSGRISVNGELIEE